MVSTSTCSDGCLSDGHSRSTGSKSCISRKSILDILSMDDDDRKRVLDLPELKELSSMATFPSDRDRVIVPLD